MSLIDDVTKADADTIAQLDRAIRATVAIVLRNPLHAGAGILGCGLQILIEQGYTKERLHQAVDLWFANNASVSVKLRRLQMHEVPPPPENEG